MIIPNAERAVVDVRKLRDYCLNSTHDEGKHKARLFESMLGMTASDAEELRRILLEVIKTHEVQLGRRDDTGNVISLTLRLNGGRGALQFVAAGLSNMTQIFQD